MFLCPRCQVPLQRTRLPDRPGVEWRCPSCRGRSLTMALLRKLVQHKDANAIWGRTFEATEKELPCAVCRAPMHRITLQYEQEPLQLDVCRSCQLVWFDEYELEELPRQPPPANPDADVPPLVRRTLAIAEVQDRIERAKAQQPLGLGDPRLLPAILGLPIEMQAATHVRRPWATWITIAVIGAVSIVGFSDPGLVLALAMIPERLPETMFAGVVTVALVHASWSHLLGNLWFLLLVGDDVEAAIGPRRWLWLLLGATIAGSVCELLTFPPAATVYVGASGGISGLLVFYALRYPDARLGLLPCWPFLGLRPRPITFSARTGLWSWLAMQAFIAFDQHLSGGHIAVFAHAGGAAVGALFWLREPKERVVGDEGLDKAKSDSFGEP